MRLIKSIFAAALLAAILPAAAQADFPRVCRGGSLFKYDNEIKKAVKAKLDAAHVTYKRVAVDYLKVDRPHDKYISDFDSDLTLGSGATPAVSFTGAFPALTPCTISFKLKITVVYADGTRATTITSASAPGTLLPPLNRLREAGDE